MAGPDIFKYDINVLRYSQKYIGKIIENTTLQVDFCKI